MASLSSKEYFSNLKQCCKEVDGLFMELNELLSGRRRGEPKGTLARLESEFSDLKENMESELRAMQAHKEKLSKTYNMCRSVVDAKKRYLKEVEEKVERDAQSEIPALNNERYRTDVKKTRGLHTTEAAKTPLRPIENTTCQGDQSQTDQAEVERDVSKRDCGKPASSSQKFAEICTPPKLCDYLSMDDMCEILNSASMRSRSSKKSSSRKALHRSTPNLTTIASPERRSLSTRKQLFSATPGKPRALELPSTPVMPKVENFVRPKFFNVPQPDFSGRIATVAVQEFHDSLDNTMRSLIQLETINKCVDIINHMFTMETNCSGEEPIKREDLVQLIHPIVGARSKLCLSLLIKLNRIKQVRGAPEKILPVYGRHPTKA